MREVTVRAWLSAEREVRECLESREYPKAAEWAVRSAYGYCDDWDDKLAWAGVLGALERASKLAGIDPEGVYGRLLPDALKRMRPLVARAEEAERCADACCC